MMSSSLAILEDRPLHGLNHVGWLVFVCLFVLFAVFDFGDVFAHA